MFKQNKSDFDYVCCYIIEDIIKLVLETDSVGVIKVSLKNILNCNVCKIINFKLKKLQRHFFNIIFNLMDICSLEEMRKLMYNIQGSSLMVLKNAYEEYRLNVKFTGRL